MHAKFVAPEYFHVMRIELLEGRAIERIDHEQVTNSIVINRVMATRFWAGQSPIGRRIRHGNRGSWLTVVGVVEEVSNRALSAVPESLVYMPMVDTPGAMTAEPRAMTLVLRTDGEPSALAQPVRDLIWSSNPDLPVANMTSMSAFVSRSMARVSFTMTILGIAAAMALLLGAVGLYGVISYVVSQRTQEIGIRMALGAEAGAVRGLVLRRGMRLAIIGIGIGLVGAGALSRFLTAFLFGVRAIDPLTYGAVALLLAAVALFATYWPARRASRVDPLVAMRTQ